MDEENDERRAGMVADDLGVCLVCKTADSDGQFVIGPFPTAAHAEVYAASVGQVLAEDVVVHGIVVVWSPETFAQVQQQWRSIGIAPGKALDVRKIHRRVDPEL